MTDGIDELEDGAQELADGMKEFDEDGIQELTGKESDLENVMDRLDALRDSWYDLDAHYDALETRFWQFYPRMMAQASRKAL